MGVTTLTWAIALLAMAQPPQDRVAAARQRCASILNQRFEAVGLKYPPRRALLRIYKRERILEMWAENARSGPLKKVCQYAVAAMSGDVGPKRRQGDFQAPEGIYFIDRFNPQSQYHLSMRLNYPNASDRARGEASDLGGDIYIHGDMKSIGCFAMTDDYIDEIYLTMWDAYSRGQKKIPALVFPTKMDAKRVKDLSKSFPQHAAFWQELAPFDLAFERTHLGPRYNIAKDGAYRLLNGS